MLYERRRAARCNADVDTSFSPSKTVFWCLPRCNPVRRRLHRRRSSPENCGLHRPPRLNLAILRQRKRTYSVVCVHVLCLWMQPRKRNKQTSGSRILSKNVEGLCGKVSRSRSTARATLLAPWPSPRAISVSSLGTQSPYSPVVHYRAGALRDSHEL